MSRSMLLLILLLVELLVGAWFVWDRLHAPAPVAVPEADWTLLDPATVKQIQAARSCQRPDDWRRLGELYMAVGCFREAEICHREASRREPENVVFLRQWGFALERLARLEEANDCYREAMARAPRDADRYRYHIARNLLRMEKPVEARRLFDEGKALPANRYELARLQRHVGESADAEESLLTMMAIEPDVLQGYVLRYRIMLEKNDAQQARRLADLARYAPKKLPTPFDDEAQRIVSVTQQLGPNQRWQEARERISSGLLNEALATLSEGEQVPALNELRAEIAMRQQRGPLALSLLQEMQQRQGISGRIAGKIGDVHMALNQPEQAKAAWLQAAQLPANVDLKATHHKLADLLAKQGVKNEADWHRARGHYYVGRDLLQIGHPDKAISYFEAAVKHDPAFTQAWFYLGETRRFSKQEASAREAYRQCLERNPDHGRALNALAIMAGKP